MSRASQNSLFTIHEETRGYKRATEREKKKREKQQVKYKVSEIEIFDEIWLEFTWAQV